MDEHEAVVDALVARGGICVHHIQLSPQVVPVLSPAVVGFQPTSTSPVWTLSHVQTGTDTSSSSSTVSSCSGLPAYKQQPSLDIITCSDRYRHFK